jgi:electron transfer flavoprotein beta subunit
MVPDVVEDLEVASDAKALNLEYLRMILNESDGHALEQALLLKERYGGSVTVLTLDAPEVDDAIYSALAKGADRAVKIVGFDPSLSTRDAARVFSQTITHEPGLLPADLILTGVQAIDDLDGLIAPLVAHDLNMPNLGIITQLTLDPAGKTATAIKEYPGGVRGEFEVVLPAVLGIQAAEKPPRYVPVARVRTAMKSQKIDSRPAPAPAEGAWPRMQVVEMKRNEPAGHARMLEGDAEVASEELCEILAGRGLL